MANNIKFTGIASGLDTESIVNSMVLPYKNKVDNSKKQETLLEWKKDAYKEVSSKVYNFYTKTASNLRLESTFNKKKLTASINLAIELDTTSTVPSGTHTIDKITQMATSARLQTKKLTSGKDEAINLNTKLTDLGFQEGDELTVSDASGTNKTIKFLSAEKIAEEKADTSIDKTNITYVELSKEVIDKNGNKTTESVGEIKELQSVLSKALPNSTISFNETAGAFFMSSKTTGASQNIKVESNRSGALDAMGIASYETKDNKTISTASGQNAIYSYNGIDGIESTTNNIDIGGLKFTIKDITLVEGAENEGNAIYNPITITSTDDIDGMMGIVKDFVDEYNTLIEELNDMLNADSAKGYEPLTDEEKEAMSESQIEKWETKIKDSLLRNDSTLKSLLTSMRTTLSGIVEGNEFKSLARIGITTGTYTENGKLYLDEDKLKEALSKDADAVVQLLAGSGDPEATFNASNKDSALKYSDLSSEEQTKWKNKTLGIFDRTYNSLKSNFSSISNVKSSNSLFNDLLWNTKITNQAKEIDKWQERLENMEKMYYSKFTAMEKLMSQLNSQTGSLTSLLGG